MARKKKLDVMSLYANRSTKQTTTNQNTSKTQEPNPALAQSIVKTVSTRNTGASVIAGKTNQTVSPNPTLARNIVNRVTAEKETQPITIKSGAASSREAKTQLTRAQRRQELGNIERIGTVERIGKSARSGVKDWAASYMDYAAAGTGAENRIGAELTEDKLKQYQHEMENAKAVMASYENGDGVYDEKDYEIAKDDAALFQRYIDAYSEANVANKNISLRTSKEAEKLHRSAAQDTSEATEGLGKVGSLLVRGVGSTVQNALDLAVGGFGARAAFPSIAARVYGQSTQEALSNGKSREAAVAIGINKAAAELLPELLFDGNPLTDSANGGIVTQLTGDALSSPKAAKLRSVLEKISDNKYINNFLTRTGADAFGEGTEEVITQGLNDLIDKIAYGDEKEKTSAEDYAEAFWGGVIGSIYGKATHPGGFLSDVREDVSDVRQRNAEASQQEERTFARAVADEVNARKAAQEAAQQAPQPTEAGTAPNAENAPSGVFNTAQDAQETKPTQTVADIYANRATKQPDGSVQVGRATTIKKPYTGTVPVQEQHTEVVVPISDESLSTAQSRIAEAKADASKNSFRAALSAIYKKVFQPMKNIPIDSMTYEGQPYTVDVNKGVYRKVINDKAIYAEKLSLLDNLPQVIQNAQYVGSGEYGKAGRDDSPAIRYDYFETAVNIGGKDYAVLFDVEVLPSANNYRTHRIVEIDISPVEIDNETGKNVTPQRPSDQLFHTGLSSEAYADTHVSNDTITRDGESVKPVTLEESIENFNRMSDEFGERLQQIQEESRTREIREDEVKWLEERGNWLNEEKQRIVGLQRQAQGLTSKNRGTAENHIDNRNWDAMRKPSIKSFQFDHPELHKYYAQMAEQLRDTVGFAMGGDRVVQTRKGRYINKSEVPSVIRGLVDSGATREEIMKACEAIINDEGQENYALAKRVEILLDDLLTNGSGFEQLYGKEGFARVEPNSEYIAKKAAIEGGSAEAELRARKDAESDEFVRMVEGDEWVDALEARQREAAPDGRDMDEGSVSPEGSTGAAPAGFDPVSQWQMEADEYHPVNEAAAQTTLENRGRVPMDIPTTDRNGRQVSKLVSTLVNANITTNEAASALAEDARNGVFSAIPYTDDAAAQKAEEHIGKVGWDVAFGEYQNEVMSGKVSKDINMMGIALYNNAVNAGALADAMDVISLLTKGARTSAQSLQVLNMINKASPESQLYLAMRGLGALVEDAQKRYGKRAENVSIDEALLQEYKDALMRGDEKAAEKVWNQVIRDVAQQIPSNFAERLNNWRYLSMLGNPRTHVRNLAGNLGFAPVRVVSNMISTGIQSVVLDKANRRRAFMNFAKEENQARFKEAWKYYGEAMDSSHSGGKYSDAMNELDAARTIFKPKVLEAIRKGNSKALDIEDQWFSQPAFAYALSSYMAAHNIPADALNAPTMSTEMAEGIKYAVNQAERATYRDSNAFSDWVTKAGENNKVTRGIKSAVLPFKRTPANILVRGVEYSPVGFVKGLTYDLAQVKKGNMTAAEAIDNISAGFTGTGLLALGVYLASQGLISAGDDPEDDEQNWFNDLMGYQNYALNVGGKSITIDWLAPEVMPLFVGVELQKAFADKKMNLSEALQALGRVTNPMIETSMLSSIDDLMDAMANANGNNDYAMALLTSAAASYLGQYIPTLGGQLERTIEKQRYETYRYNDTGVLGLSPSAQNQLGKMLNKVPGVEYGQIPYIDAWGREEESGNVGTRIWNNFFNPAYVNDIQRGEVEEELQRLHDASYSGVLPDRPSQSTKIQQLGGERMTKEEYVQYARTKGSESLRMISELMQSEYYDKLDDDERAELITEIYSIATDEAKRQIVTGRDIEYSSSYDKYQSIEDPALYLAMKETLKQLRSSNGADSEAFDAVYKQWKGLSTNEKKKYTEGVDGEFSGIDTLKKLDACIRGGMSTEQFYKAKNKHDEINDDESLNASEKRAQFANWLDTKSRFTTAQKRTALSNFPYTTTLVADEGNYEKLTAAGVSKDGGMRLFNAMQELEPAEGYNDVANWQKCEAVTGSSLSDEEQLAALSVYATDSSYSYYQAAYDCGVSPSKWSDVQANIRGYEGQTKSNGKDTYSANISQESLCRAMFDAGLSDAQAEAMYNEYRSARSWTKTYWDAMGDVNWSRLGYRTK